MTLKLSVANPFFFFPLIAKLTYGLNWVSYLLKISLHQFFGIIKSFDKSNFRNYWIIHNKFPENLHLCNLRYHVKEIVYSELSTEEKVEIILMQSVAIILAKQQNSNVFKIFNHASKSRQYLRTFRKPGKCFKNLALLE